MLKKLLSFIWKHTPYFLRLKIIRATQTKFTVSVAAIIFNDTGEVLLLNHVFRAFSNWGIPGGFIENGEQPEAAVKRELFEETGLELKNVQMFRVRTIARHVEILFRAEAIGKAEVKSREIHEVGWFSPDRLPETLSNVQKVLIEKVLSQEI